MRVVGLGVDGGMEVEMVVGTEADVEFEREEAVEGVVGGDLEMAGSRRGRIRLLRGRVGVVVCMVVEGAVGEEVEVVEERRRRGFVGQRLGWGFGNLGRPLQGSMVLHNLG